MATKTTQSTSTTVSNVNGRQSISTSSTVTRRKLSNQERAQSGLSNLLRLEMIGITVLTVSIGSAVSDFSTSDLIETNPNYQVTNSYVGYEDPLNDINYQQYGEQVVYNLTTFLGGLAVAGNLAKNLWDGVNNFIGGSWISTEGSFASQFGESRWIQVYDHYQKYYEEGAVAQRAYIYVDILTLSEKAFIENTLNHDSFSSLEKQVFLSTRWYLIYQDLYGLFGTVNNTYFFFTEPSVYTMIVSDL